MSPPSRAPHENPLSSRRQRRRPLSTSLVSIRIGLPVRCTDLDSTHEQLQHQHHRAAARQDCLVDEAPPSTFSPEKSWDSVFEPAASSRRTLDIPYADHRRRSFRDWSGDRPRHCDRLMALKRKRSCFDSVLPSPATSMSPESSNADTEHSSAMQGRGPFMGPSACAYPGSPILAGAAAVEHAGNCSERNLNASGRTLKRFRDGRPPTRAVHGTCAICSSSESYDNTL